MERTEHENIYVRFQIPLTHTMIQVNQKKHRLESTAASAMRVIHDPIRKPKIEEWNC